MADQGVVDAYQQLKLLNPNMLILTEVLRSQHAVFLQPMAALAGAGNLQVGRAPPPGGGVSRVVPCACPGCC
jgi:hypothetical protein